jgi:hypothetical protein
MLSPYIFTRLAPNTYEPSLRRTQVAALHHLIGVRPATAGTKHIRPHFAGRLPVKFRLGSVSHSFYQQYKSQLCAKKFLKS